MHGLGRVDVLSCKRRLRARVGLHWVNPNLSITRADRFPQLQQVLTGEWSVSLKVGSKCQFQRSILQRFTTTKVAFVCCCAMWISYVTVANDSSEWQFISREWISFLIVNEPANTIFQMWKHNRERASDVSRMAARVVFIWIPTLKLSWHSTFSMGDRMEFQSDSHAHLCAHVECSSCSIHWSMQILGHKRAKKRQKSTKRRSHCQC